MQLKRQVMAALVAVMLIATAVACALMVSSFGSEMPHYKLSAQYSTYQIGDEVKFYISAHDGASLDPLNCTVDIIRLPDNFTAQELFGPASAFGDWCVQIPANSFSPGMNSYSNGTRVATVNVTSGSFSWNSTIFPEFYAEYEEGKGIERPMGIAPAGTYVAVPAGKPYKDSDAKWVLDISSAFVIQGAA